MTKGRYEVVKQYGISPKDTARFEAVQGVTILSNTVPSGFWTLFHVLSRPSILEIVRAEAIKLLSISESDGRIIRTLDVSKIREVSILVSTMQESLRHQGLGSGTRMVVEDTMLDSRYLLQKGAFLMMPNEPFHFNEIAWGPNVHAFDASRFTKSESSHKMHSGAFRAFGGGANLCPGRFFATTEILSMVCMCALRYDISPVNGKWTDPKPDISIMSSIVLPPKEKLMVNIEARKGMENGAWAFKIE